MTVTDMRRLTVALPDELVTQIVELKQESRFQKSTYSEIIRQLCRIGLDALASEREAG